MNKIHAPFPGGATPQVVTADAVFPDGRRAAHTRLLHGSYPEEAEASLQPVPVILEKDVPDEELTRMLKEAGWAVRAVEKGEFEVVFVVEPGVLESMSSFGLSTQSNPLSAAEQIQAIVANDSLTAFTLLDAAASDRSWRESLPQYRSRAGPPPRNPVGSWIRGLFLAPSSVPGQLLRGQDREDCEGRRHRPAFAAATLSSRIRRTLRGSSPEPPSASSNRGDGAKSWKRFGEPKADAQVTSLAFDAAAGKLYAGTLESGVLVLPAR